MPSLRLEGLSFAWADQAPILDVVDLDLPAGWAGLTGENGAGKTTLLRLLAGELQPAAGRVLLRLLAGERQPAAGRVLLRLLAGERPGAGGRVALCPQAVEGPAGQGVAALAARTDGEARRLRDRLRLEPPALLRWGTLSPGERRRWQLGAALSAEPDLLLLDEPTNHADAGARAVLVAALAAFRGVGVLVSHDRALLEALCTRTLRLHRGALALFPGPYGAARAAWEGERSAAWARRGVAQAAARAAAARLQAARRTREAAERAQSGRRLDRHDSDARTLGAKTRRAWAEARLGRDVSRLQSAAARARAEVPELPDGPDLGREVALLFERAPRPVLLSLVADELRAGGDGVAAGGPILLRDVSLQLRREDRVRLEGPNGAGKSTLLAALLARSTLPSARLLVLPQELGAAEALALLEEVRALAPEPRGRTLSLVAALGCDPGRLLASAAPSPGEARKIALALGLARRAWALVLDEPTNHLDLPSVERLEGALAAYPGALLLVTHDDAFAARLTTSSWRIADGRVARGCGKVRGHGTP